MSSPSDSFVASGSSPTEPDFFCENHGSIFLLRPVSSAAHSWISDHLAEDGMTFGNAIVIEHRYIRAILEGIQKDALAVQG